MTNNLKKNGRLSTIKQLSEDRKMEPIKNFYPINPKTYRGLKQKTEALKKETKRLEVVVFGNIQLLRDTVKKQNEKICELERKLQVYETITC